jgi:RND family efflux transporter MFP subunit
MNKLMAVLAAALPLVSLSSCSSPANNPKQQAAIKPIPVHTATVTFEDWPVTYEATGTLKAATASVIASRINSAVQSVAVRQGDHVSAGQLLVKLDSRDLDLSAHKAEAIHAEAVNALPELESAAASAKASLDLAQSTAKRMDNLFGTKSISPQEHDESQARLKSAEAAYQMAQSRRTQGQSRVEQTEQEVKSSAVNRDYSRIVAPFAGVVTERTVEPGSMALVGAPLLTIEKEGPLRLEAAIDESRLPSVRTHQKVQFKVDAANCEGIGTVDEVVPVVDPASRSYLAKVSVPCPGSRSGMFGRVFVATGSRKALAISTGAVVSRGQLQSVFVIESGTAHSRLVTLGEQSGGSTEVLSGLNAGDYVVTLPVSGLVDGAPVEAQQ